MGQIEDLQDLLRDFATRRDWGKFHTPKNLAMAVAGEAGELAAELQWLTADESVSLDDERHHAVTEEVADIAIYLLRIADVLDIDLEAAVRAKVARNESRFPTTEP
jgi:NTP pyrophosphatase (non-canonical NTP hydrolase)